MEREREEERERDRERNRKRARDRASHRKSERQKERARERERDRTNTKGGVSNPFFWTLPKETLNPTHPARKRMLFMACRPDIYRSSHIGNTHTQIYIYILPIC